MRLTEGGWILVVISAIWSLTAPNAGLILAALATLLWLIHLLWRKGEPPILFVCMFMQLLQASTKVFQANSAGKSINDYNQSPYGEDSVWYSLLSLCVIAFAAWLAMRKLNRNGDIYRAFVASAYQISIRTALWIYAFSFFVSIVLKLILFVVPQLTQILVVIINLKWACYALLAYVILIRRQHYAFLLGVFTLEMLLGFSGYFASFKEVLLVSGIVFLTIYYNFKPQLLVLMAPGVYVVVYLFFVWTGIKQEYRSFLNGGSNQQVVNVSTSESLSKLYSLFSNFDTKGLKEAQEVAFDRLSYTDMLMFCMETVPARLPFQNGILWGDAVGRVLKPRLFFPDKAPINDSEVANKYTGRSWSGVEEGTSISIGYVAESYVDFGLTGMFVPLFLLGYMVGYIYYYFLSRHGNVVLLFGIIISILLSFNLLEASGNKIIGGLLMHTLVIGLLVRNFLPRINSFVESKRLSI